MLHWLYRFCWLAVCRENWVGFCVRNIVSHIYGSFYFSVSGFCMFLRVRGFVMGRPTEYLHPYYIFINVYISTFLCFLQLCEILQGIWLFN